MRITEQDRMERTIQILRKADTRMEDAMRGMEGIKLPDVLKLYVELQQTRDGNRRRIRELEDERARKYGVNWAEWDMRNDTPDWENNEGIYTCADADWEEEESHDTHYAGKHECAHKKARAS